MQTIQRVNCLTKFAQNGAANVKGDGAHLTTIVDDSEYTNSQKEFVEIQTA